MSDPVVSDDVNYSHLNRNEIISMLKKSQDNVAQLNENCRMYRLKITALEKRVAAAETKADHFDILISAVKENELVKAAWERFMMTLRMTGYDGK